MLQAKRGNPDVVMHALSLFAREGQCSTIDQLLPNANVMRNRLRVGSEHPTGGDELFELAGSRCPREAVPQLGQNEQRHHQSRGFGKRRWIGAVMTEKIDGGV